MNTAAAERVGVLEDHVVRLAREFARGVDTQPCGTPRSARQLHVSYSSREELIHSPGAQRGLWSG
jgi:hypothetical protein